MSIDAPKLPLLEQREIEAGIVGPLVHAFAAEIGRERTVAILRRVIGQLARRVGPTWQDFSVNKASRLFHGHSTAGVKTAPWRST